MAKLNVWWDNQLVGSLVQDSYRKLNFMYSKSWLDSEEPRALSLSLPLQSKVFGIDECRPFFVGLLPEQSQKVNIANGLGIPVTDYFSLLTKLGEDVAGAVQLLPPNKKPSSISGKVQTKPLSSKKLVDIIDELPQKPYLIGRSPQLRLRASLAGAQTKLPVVIVDGKIGLPLRGQPSTHIIKPAIPDLVASTENEALIMRLAKNIGLDVADVKPLVVSSRTLLLIERYDRVIGHKGKVERLHQEDFCQALRFYPEDKYTLNLIKCFSLIRKSSYVPAVDNNKLFDAVVFNLIVGNADAHGKNFSMLFEKKGPYLAPLYDLLSTVYYPKFTPNLAMKIGKCNTLDELQVKHWERLSRTIELGMPYIKKRILELCNLILVRIENVALELQQPGFNNAAITEIKNIVRDRTLLCLKTV